MSTNNLKIIKNSKYEHLLTGYEKLKPSMYKNIKPGDRIRYFIDKEFRYGGTIKINKFPEYMVLINPRLKKTWCLQFKQPKLIIFLMKLENIQKENKLKNEIYKKYINGELSTT